MRTLLSLLIAAIAIPSLAQQTGKKQGLADMLLEYFSARFPDTVPTEHLLYVSVHRQRLYHLQSGSIKKEYLISTSANGLGATFGSERTPEGLHRIAEKIGMGVPPGGLLRERVFAGQYADTTLGQDQITARILWLDGLEVGNNVGGTQDSFSRAIYIHGTPFESDLGRPASHGCIRMADTDIMQLFDVVPLGTMVIILDN